MTHLTEKTLTRLDAAVAVPRYDRRDVSTGPVRGTGPGRHAAARPATEGAVTSMRRIVIYPGRIAVETAGHPTSRFPFSLQRHFPCSATFFISSRGL